MVEAQGYLILLFLSIVSIILIRSFSKSGRPQLPPSPFRLPVIGHLHLLAPIPHQALYKLSLKHGPVFRLILGSIPCVVASSPNLPYLQAIVTETLRLHPVAPMIPRKSTRDCTVMGYHIPAGTTVYVNLWALGRDAKHWEDPLKFRRERFEESKLDIRGQHFQLLPFGSGRRMCPGISLALLVSQAALGAMIQCFEWKAREEGNLASVDMEEGHGLTLPRANPLVCVPVIRLNRI